MATLSMKKDFKLKNSKKIAVFAEKAKKETAYKPKSNLNIKVQ